MKKTIIIALAIYAFCATVGDALLIQDRNEWEDKGRNLLKATDAVDTYIEKTADTGEMDEFLQSQEGRDYIKYTEQ